MDVSPLYLRSSCDRRNKKNIVLRQNISRYPGTRKTCGTRIPGYPVINRSLSGSSYGVWSPKLGGYPFVAGTMRISSCKAVQQRSIELGAHRQPRATPHAGHNMRVPAWQSSIQWRSGGPPSWTYPRAGTRATKSTRAVLLRHNDVVTQTSHPARLKSRQSRDASPVCA